MAREMVESRVKPLELSAAASASRSAWQSWAERDDLASTPMSASSSTSSSTSFASTVSSAPSSPDLDRSIDASPAKFGLGISQRDVLLDEWQPKDFSLGLQFTQPNAGPSSSRHPAHHQGIDSTLPPAFFPSSRISFSPRLRVTAPQGVKFRCLGGMHLGVTGMCEVLDDQGNVQTKRMIADFCTDLSSGLAIWKRDALAAQRAEGIAAEDDDDAVLGQGLYVLPLSMRIPNSERL